MEAARGHLPDLEDLAPELVTGWTPKDVSGLLDLLLDEAARWCERHLPRVRATPIANDQGLLRLGLLGGEVYLERRDARVEALAVRLVNLGAQGGAGGAASLRLLFIAITQQQRYWLTDAIPWGEVTPATLLALGTSVHGGRFVALERGIDWTLAQNQSKGKS